MKLSDVVPAGQTEPDPEHADPVGQRATVVWWHPCITDYRHGLFERLSRSFDLRLFLMVDSPFTGPHAQVHFTSGGLRGPSINPLRVPWRDVVGLARLVGDGDVFVSSFTLNAYTLAGLVVARWRRTPVVVWEEMQRLPRNGLLAGPKRWLLRWASRRVSAYWVLGQPQRELLLQLGVVPSRIFQCGEVPAERYADVPAEPLDIELADDLEVVLFLGRLIPIKGVDVLLLAMAELQARRPVALLIAGDGELRGSLETLARELDLRHVHFLGHVARREHKAWLLRRADVLAVPSIFLGDWAEGGPLVIPEALSAGTPVVCTQACGNTTDYVRMTGCGRVVPPADAAALAVGLDEVLAAAAPREHNIAAAARLPSADQQAREFACAIQFAVDGVDDERRGAVVA